MTQMIGDLAVPDVPLEQNRFVADTDVTFDDWSNVVHKGIVPRVFADAQKLDRERHSRRVSSLALSQPRETATLAVWSVDQECGGHSTAAQLIVRDYDTKGTHQDGTKDPEDKNGVLHNHGASASCSEGFASYLAVAEEHGMNWPPLDQPIAHPSGTFTPNDALSALLVAFSTPEIPLSAKNRPRAALALCPVSQDVARMAHCDPSALVGHRILVVHGYVKGAAALLLGRVVCSCGASKWRVVFDSVCELLPHQCAKPASTKSTRTPCNRELRSSSDAPNAGSTVILALEAPIVLECALDPAHPTAVSWLLDGREEVKQRGTFCACGDMWSPPGTWNECCVLQGCRVRRPAASMADRRLLNTAKRGLKRVRRQGAARAASTVTPPSRAAPTTPTSLFFATEAVERVGTATGAQGNRCIFFCAACVAEESPPSHPATTLPSPPLLTPALTARPHHASVGKRRHGGRGRRYGGREGRRGRRGL